MAVKALSCATFEQPVRTCGGTRTSRAVRWVVVHLGVRHLQFRARTTQSVPLPEMVVPTLAQIGAGRVQATERTQVAHDQPPLQAQEAVLYNETQTPTTFNGHHPETRRRGNTTRTCSRSSRRSRPRTGGSRTRCCVMSRPRMQEGTGRFGTAASPGSLNSTPSRRRQPRRSKRSSRPSATANSP